jgi:hypothetical protein
MAGTTRFGQIGTPVVESGYRLGRRTDALLQHRIADRRQFLASRNASNPHGIRPIFGGSGRGELRDEPLGDEGEDE